MSDQSENQPETSRAKRVLCSLWLSAIILVLVAVLYYGSYVRSGLNLGGEGGTAAVVAMRLMEGQRPMADTFLGYNVMWFYPVAWLFEITGPDYIALRAYFFAMCLVTALLGFIILWRVTGLAWYAFLFALVLVLIPGMLFRNYMGFLPVLNMLTLLGAAFWYRSLRAKWGWTVAAGLALGLTYLIRIDLGVFFTVLATGMAVMLSFRRRPTPSGGEQYALVSGTMVAAKAMGENWMHCAGRRLAQLAVILAVAFVVHVPFYADARARNYDHFFIEQYSLWVKLIQWNLKVEWEQFRKKTAPPPAANTSPAAVEGQAETSGPAPAEAAIVTETPEESTASVLKRRPLSDIKNYRNFRNQSAVFALYAPLLSAPLLVLSGGLALLLGWLRQNPKLFEEGGTVLLATGAALTLFPQYFFFRPDPPHLSEFMVPFNLALALGIYFSLRRAWEVRKVWVWITSLVLVAAWGFNLAAFVSHCLGRESAGSRGPQQERTHELVASNGVRVWLRKSDRDDLQAMHDLIVSNSEPGEFLACFPYSPTINFMTDRPSHLWNLYVDDVTAYDGYFEEAKADIAKYRPAVIVVDNRDINRTEHSRFRNWASEVYEYIRTHYRLAAEFGSNEVYLRRDQE